MTDPDFSRLNGYGYFPATVPSTFSSVKFGDWASAVDLKYAEPKNAWTRLCRYSASKRNGQRRQFSIPNPISQFHIQQFFVANSAAILSEANASAYSFSKPLHSEDRCIKITPHAEVSRIRFRSLSEFKFIVYLDIARYYPSIYTHSIPWAALGKSAAKAALKSKAKKSIFDDLDTLVRNAQDGQTLGIPVGPDSSRVIAEIVNAAIDRGFGSDHPTATVVRHVDDVWIGADTHANAAALLQSYREHLLHFELDVNDAKTSISRNHIGFVDLWPSQLNAALLEFNDPINETDRASAFLAAAQLCFDLSSRQNDDALIKYLLRRIDTEDTWNASDLWPDIESFLLQCILHFPHSIDYVAEIVAWRSLKDLPLSDTKWKRVLESTIDEHTKLRNDSEVVWCLWCCLQCKIKISEKLASAIVRMKSDFAACMLFCLQEKGLVDGTIDAGLVVNTFELDNTIGGNWLLAHEARVRGWIPAASLSIVTDHPFLERLRFDSVSFIDPEALPSNFYGKDGKLLNPELVTTAIFTSDDYEDATDSSFDAAMLAAMLDKS